MFVRASNFEGERFLLLHNGILFCGRAIAPKTSKSILYQRRAGTSKLGPPGLQGSALNHEIKNEGRSLLYTFVLHFLWDSIKSNICVEWIRGQLF
jgi:hypothetical protein